jgi:hypothetical protein
MKLHLRYLIICLWSFSLLVSTVGIRLYAVYCYCLDQTTYSLFNDENQLVASFSDDLECCLTVEETSSKSCCSPTPTIALPSTSKINFSDPGCMKTSSKQLVLGVDLHDVLVLVKNIKVALTTPSILLPSIPVYTIDISLLPIPEHVVPPELPPSRSGRTICLLHEIARC